MHRTYVYLTEELDKKIDRIALLLRISKAEVMRQAMQHGLKSVSAQQKPTSATDTKVKSPSTLLQLAETARQLDVYGPRDLSSNHDKYLWEE